MKKTRTPQKLFCIVTAMFLLTIFSCNKEKPPVPTIPSGTNNPKITTPAPTATPAQLGLYEVDSSIYKGLFINVTQIGTQTVPPIYSYFNFDTGSGGMVIDGYGILPASMISNSGFNFNGDSTIVNGITLTKQTAVISYGGDAASTFYVYGNLAYAAVTIGDQNGKIVIKRLPFFLYYKATNGAGTILSPHDFDIFGVDEAYAVSFPNNAKVTSPFSYFDPGPGLTRGFKIAALGTGNFSFQGTDVPGVITLGLTSADLSSSSGFVMHQLSYNPTGGYPPVIPASIIYNGMTVSTNLIFDTGSDPYDLIENPSYNGTPGLLPANTSVQIVTSSGFKYNYVITTADYFTAVENPNTSGGNLSIQGLEFFLHNEYMLNFANHSLGLKNN